MKFSQTCEYWHETNELCGWAPVGLTDHVVASHDGTSIFMSVFMALLNN